MNTAEPVSEGDLARQSLLLLAEDPAQQPALRGLIENPPAEALEGVLAAIAVGTAALCVLQASVKIGRDKDGHWTFQFAKKPLSEPLLNLLIEKLGGYLQGK
jgi:hypothetical protein